MVIFYKCIFLFPFFNILFTGLLYSQTERFRELQGFRGVAWGSTMNKVKATETERYMQLFHGFGIDALSYKGNVAGLTARIDYSFKENKLIEGTYSINPGNYFKTDFNKLKNFLRDKYGNPDFRVGPFIDSDSVWIKVTDYGQFRGPELYWKFRNGFIALVASKFDEEITLTVLYTNSKSIKDYGKDRLISTEIYKLN